MFNILHIANYKAIYRGNFIASLDCLTAKLEKEGIKSYYIFPSADIDWMENLKAEGRQIGCLTESVIKDARLIRQVIKNFNIGIIHTHFISLKHYISIMLATCLLKTKIVMHFHNHPQNAGKVKGLLRRILYKKCTMIGCSQSVKDSLVKCFPKNQCFAVLNGIDFSRLEYSTKISASDYSLRDNTYSCLIFGFDYFRKGVDLALNAINKLNADSIKYELLISLSTNEDKVLSEIKNIFGSVPEWVHVIRARNDIASLYNFVDVFLSPSREEGFCYSAVEAEYCNCSVVVTKIPAQQDLYLPTGIYVDSNSVSALAEGIVKAISMKTEKQKKIGEIKAALRKKYDVSGWAEEIVSVYTEICK